MPLEARRAGPAASARRSRAAPSSCERLKPLPVEAVVRGYLIGSGWKDYQRTGAVCGIALPGGLRRRTACRSRSSRRRPRRPRASTTRTSAYARDRGIVGAGARGAGARARARALRARPTTRSRARHHHRGHEVRVRPRRATATLVADRRGADARLLALLAARTATRRARSPPSFDKQYVRDYLETLDWDKRPPGPAAAAPR